MLHRTATAPSRNQAKAGNQYPAASVVTRAFSPKMDTSVFTLNDHSP